MTKEQKPKFLFLMETISRKQRMEGLRVKLDFDSMFVVDRVGAEWRSSFILEGGRLGNPKLLS